MASSSSNKGTIPYLDRDELPPYIDVNSPNVLKEFGRAFDLCHGCLRTRADLGNVNFKNCGGCRSALYCSSGCQVAHWKKEHKRVCKNQRKQLANLRDIAGPNYFVDLKQWEVSSCILLDHLVAVMLQEAAVSAECSPGLSVTAEWISRHFIAVVKADYTMGSRLPFRIREYGLVCYDAVEDTPVKGLQATLKELREEAERAKAVSSDSVQLNMILNACGTLRLKKSKMDQELVVKILDQAGTPSELKARTGKVSELKAKIVDNINEGFLGAGTTKSSAANQKANHT